MSASHPHLTLPAAMLQRNKALPWTSPARREGEEGWSEVDTFKVPSRRRLSLPGRRWFPPGALYLEPLLHVLPQSLDGRLLICESSPRRPRGTAGGKKRMHWGGGHLLWSDRSGTESLMRDGGEEWRTRWLMSPQVGFGLQRQSPGTISNREKPPTRMQVHWCTENVFFFCGHFCFCWSKEVVHNRYSWGATTHERIEWKNEVTYWPAEDSFESYSSTSPLRFVSFCWMYNCQQLLQHSTIKNKLIFHLFLSNLLRLKFLLTYILCHFV